MTIFQAALADSVPALHFDFPGYLPEHGQRQPQPPALELFERLVVARRSAPKDAGELFGIVGALARLVAAQDALLILSSPDETRLARCWRHGGGQMSDWLARETILRVTAWGDLLNSQDIGLVSGVAIRPLPCGASAAQVLCVPVLDASHKLYGTLLLLNPDPAWEARPDSAWLAPASLALGQLLADNHAFARQAVAIAELEAARWELWRSRNTLRALFDHLPDPIYIVDARFTLVAINTARAARIGVSPQQLVGRTCYQALFGRSERCSGCRVTETLCTGASTTRSLLEPAQGGAAGSEWEIYSFPIWGEEASALPVQAIVLENDVTEKRTLEASLIHSEKLSALGQLSAGIAHEINNPLTAILANAQLLQREATEQNLALQEPLQLIELAALRASQVVQNLLGAARREQYMFAWIDLNENIRAALMLVQHEIRARTIRLELDLAANLPSIHASSTHLHGVWINLALNACDAIGAAEGTIRFSTRLEANQLVVTVRDTGQGIALEHRARIFEPFFTTKAHGKGTGLGLSVCQRVVQQHGGAIRVENGPGPGTQFTICLPVAVRA